MLSQAGFSASPGEDDPAAGVVQAQHVGGVVPVLNAVAVVDQVGGRAEDGESVLRPEVPGLFAQLFEHLVFAAVAVVALTQKGVREPVVPVVAGLVEALLGEGFLVVVVPEVFQRHLLAPEQRGQAAHVVHVRVRLDVPEQGSLLEVRLPVRPRVDEEALVVVLPAPGARRAGAELREAKALGLGEGDLVVVGETLRVVEVDHRHPARRVLDERAVPVADVEKVDLRALHAEALSLELDTELGYALTIRT
ncbi:MAG: hypothetical protein ACT4QF_19300 [Sporichthyaceae bacterium]